MIYADTNVFTRAYLIHPESEAALGIIREHSLPWTVLHQIEFPNAIWRTLFDGRNRGQQYIDENQALAILADNEEKFSNREGLHPLPVSCESVVGRCSQISARQTA